MKKKETIDPLQQFASLLNEAAEQRGRDLMMPGLRHYQPKRLLPYLGYDQWAPCCAAVEWAWLYSLAKHRVMPQQARMLLTTSVLENMMRITTTEMTMVERAETGHDIMALLVLLRPFLPAPLRPWLHFGLTSYDVICTAYALQLRLAHHYAFMPFARETDAIWREKILEYAEVARPGATHLQTAIPVTVGSWLGNLHSRFYEAALLGERLVGAIPGKFSGAVGNRAALVALFGAAKAHALEETALAFLHLPPSSLPSHQETSPGPMMRFYGSLVELSAALANLGEDLRHLQSTWVGEVNTGGSRSSAMPHKSKNPVKPENMAGTYRSVVGEYVKLLQNQTTDLERDLRDSSVCRGYAAILVFVTHQLGNANDVLSNFTFDTKRAEDNFRRFCTTVSSEALHLALQCMGAEDTHRTLNETIVPRALASGRSLLEEAEGTPGLNAVLKRFPRLRGVLNVPSTYLGTSAEDARRAARRVL